MHIKEYEVIINEKNSTCGFVVNLDFYKIESFLKKELQYEVFDKEGKVRVFCQDGEEILFLNLDKNLIYYAIKTINLLILGGSLQHENKIKIELKAINELADFAALSLPYKLVEKWRRKMKGYFVSIYLDLQTTSRQNRMAVKQLIFDFHLDTVYFRQLAKAILGSLGLQFKRTSK